MSDLTAQINLRPCPFCNEIPGEGAAVLHPNNDCILNGIYATHGQWNARPGEKAAILSVLEEACRRECFICMENLDLVNGKYYRPATGNTDWKHLAIEIDSLHMECRAKEIRIFMEEIKNA